MKIVKLILAIAAGTFLAAFILWVSLAVGAENTLGQDQ